MEWLWRHKMASISYQSKYLTLKLNSKTPWIKASQVARCWISKERKFLNILATWKGTGNNFQVPFVFLIIYIKRLGLKTTNSIFWGFWYFSFKRIYFQKSFLNILAIFLVFRFFFHENSLYDTLSIDRISVSNLYFWRYKATCVLKFQFRLMMAS